MCLAGGGVASPLSRPRQGGCDGWEFSTGRAATRPQPAAPRLPALQSTRLLDQVRERIRLLHYSRRTEEAYVHWTRAFVRFHGVRHPAQMGGLEVETFPGWLASERSVSASTHRQALSALIFLDAKVQINLPWLSDVGRPRVQRHLPVVLTKEEVARIFAALTGEHLLFAQLLYGTGMRIAEGLQLRVKDIDFSHRAVIVREGKGGKDRVLMLPQSLEPGLRTQLARAWTVGTRSGRCDRWCGNARRTGPQIRPDLHACAPGRRRRGAQSAGRDADVTRASQRAGFPLSTRSAQAERAGSPRACPVPQSFATSSTSLPKFSPENSLPSASGKFSRPATMSSRLFMRPSFR